MNLKLPLLLLFTLTISLAVQADSSTFEKLKAEAVALDSAQLSIALLNDYLSKNPVVDQPELAEYYYLIAKQFYYQQEYLKSLTYGVKSRAITLENDNMKDLEYKTAQLSGLNNLEMNNITEAQKLFEYALAIAEEQGSQVRVVYCLYNLGICLRSQKKHDECTKSLLRCNYLAKELGISDIVSLSLNELGRNSKDKGDLEKAAQLYYESGQVPDISEENIAISKLNIGNIRLIQQRYKEALELYISAEKRVDQEYLYTYIPLLNSIGRCYYHLGDYDSSLIYLDKALHLNLPSTSTKSQHTVELTESLEYLKLIAIAKNDQRRLAELENIEQITGLNTDLGKANAQLIIKDHEKGVHNSELEKSLQKWIIAAVALVLLILISIVLIRLYTRKKRKAYKSLIKEIDETLINHA
ncbi:tetratricopeptide repeat protein [Reichenbachiella versicolor]|uniref:tetratricopeptide repeat protein n=1 Tax=Reichenbachiella versicolor TaxID=1821036 RepID=UPI000D6E183A|nr:tetratricopeptide repeat protein [Reichenbachiella versicolor]